MVRGPRNLMRGVRSVWTAACRRARVAENIVMVVYVCFEVIGSWTDCLWVNRVCLLEKRS